ncbi:MAG TPA: hypothetical protein VHR66_22610 [Gemmataceae bacterium]|jgi:hypothetical protein|nr:hypothetical protein [Gemmataceae bacterium]
MLELLDTATDFAYADWADPRNQQHEYIIGPEPYVDDLFDEGEGD